MGSMHDLRVMVAIVLGYYPPFPVLRGHKCLHQYSLSARQRRQRQNEEILHLAMLQGFLNFIHLSWRICEVCNVPSWHTSHKKCNPTGLGLLSVVKSVAWAPSELTAFTPSARMPAWPKPYIDTCCRVSHSHAWSDRQSCVKSQNSHPIFWLFSVYGWHFG